MIRQISPFRYSPSGKFNAMGWSGACERCWMICASTPASSAASATIFWNRVRSTPPEHEKVARMPPGLSSLKASRLMSLVAARGSLHLSSGGREFGRVEYDQVEALAPVAHGAQLLENVPRKSIRLSRRASPFNVPGLRLPISSTSAEESMEVTCAAPPARQAVNGESTGIGKAIQHAPVFGKSLHSQAVVALVEVETGLVAVLDIHQEAQAVFDDLDLRGRLRAQQYAIDLR